MFHLFPILTKPCALHMGWLLCSRISVFLLRNPTKIGSSNKMDCQNIFIIYFLIEDLPIWDHGVCVSVCERESVCVCVCGWVEKRECVYISERERESVCVRVNVCACVCVCKRKRARESARKERERERERERGRNREAHVHTHTHTCLHALSLSLALDLSHWVVLTRSYSCSLSSGLSCCLSINNMKSQREQNTLFTFAFLSLFLSHCRTRTHKRSRDGPLDMSRSSCHRRAAQLSLLLPRVGDSCYVRPTSRSADAHDGRKQDLMPRCRALPTRDPGRVYCIGVLRRTWCRRTSSIHVSDLPHSTHTKRHTMARQNLAGLKWCQGGDLERCRALMTNINN